MQDLVAEYSNFENVDPVKMPRGTAAGMNGSADGQVVVSTPFAITNPI